MKLLIIAAVLLLQAVTADPVMVPLSETPGGASVLLNCHDISPEQESMKCMCVVAYEERYDPLENMVTANGEYAMALIMASCRLSEEAEIALENDCYDVRTNPLLDDLLLVQQGELPMVMEYNPNLGVDLSWLERCLDAVLENA